MQVFLDGLAATMQADADFKGGWYDSQRPPTLGPRAFARVYAGWGLSQPFYWEKVGTIFVPYLSLVVLLVVDSLLSQVVQSRATAQNYTIAALQTLSSQCMLWQS